jgi:hypothetical protein
MCTSGEWCQRICDEGKSCSGTLVEAAHSEWLPGRIYLLSDLN